MEASQQIWRVVVDHKALVTGRVIDLLVYGRLKPCGGALHDHVVVAACGVVLFRGDVAAGSASQVCEEGECIELAFGKS